MWLFGDSLSPKKIVLEQYKKVCGLKKEIRCKININVKRRCSKKKLLPFFELFNLNGIIHIYLAKCRRSNVFSCFKHRVISSPIIKENDYYRQILCLFIKLSWSTTWRPPTQAPEQLICVQKNHENFHWTKLNNIGSFSVDFFSLFR